MLDTFTGGGIGAPGIPGIPGIALIPGKYSGNGGNRFSSRKISWERRESHLFHGNREFAFLFPGNPGIRIFASGKSGNS